MQFESYILGTTNFEDLSSVKKKIGNENKEIARYKLRNIKNRNKRKLENQNCQEVRQKIKEKKKKPFLRQSFKKLQKKQFFLSLQ